MYFDALTLPVGHCVFVPTFQCNASCDHCNVSSSPKRSDDVPVDLFSEWIGQAIDCGWKTICLTGGEPFTKMEHIRVAGHVCTDRGASLVIQTNGYWGRNFKKAKQLLKNIDGIDQLGFSVDKAHIGEIGLDPVLNAISAAFEVGIPSVSVAVAYRDTSEYDVLADSLPKRFPGISVTGWHVLPIGRAKEKSHLTESAHTLPWTGLRGGCVARAELSPIIHPDGRLHACYRPVMALEADDPLVLGSLHEKNLKHLLSNVRSRLFMFILVCGASALGHLISQSRYRQLLSVEFQNECHFCFELLSRRDVVAYIEDLLMCSEMTQYLQSSLLARKRAWGSPSEKQRNIYH